jgi:hypothetical protein
MDAFADDEVAEVWYRVACDASALYEMLVHGIFLLISSFS